jgi:hypothetical protein
MDYSSTVNQRAQKKEKSRGRDGGTGYAAGAGAKPERASARQGGARDCDSAFLADRGYFSGAPLWVGPGHSRSAQS